jgi:magnesium transporter
MFRVVTIGPDGFPRQGGTKLLSEPASDGTLVWIDIERHSPEAERFLEEQGFHPLAIEDTFTSQHQPKVEDYGTYLFVIVRGIDFDSKEAGLETVKLAAFIAGGRLVTCHRKPLRSVDAVHHRLCEGGFVPGGSRNPGHLFYQLCDEMIDRYFPIVDEIDDGLEKLEEEIFERPKPHQLVGLLELRRRLSTLRRVMLPHRQVFNHLATPGASDYIAAQDALYYRDVMENVYRLGDAIDQQRDLVVSTKDTYLSAVGQRTNDIMKLLTLVSVILLPMSVLTGLYGMNFEVIPGAHEPSGFWWIVLGMTAIATGLVWFFRKKRWF